MRKVLGILTEDFRLYHDLVAALKARDLPFTSLSFARRVPDAVGAILTSPSEASRVHLRNVVPVDDIDSSIAKALQLLRGKSDWEELRIGVDPGREPGVAIIGDGEVIDTRIAASPEAVAFHVRQAIRTFPAKDVRVRIGHGDPTNRDRVLKALARDHLRVEAVYEAGTTHRTAQPDDDAAIEFAGRRGLERRRLLLPQAREQVQEVLPALRHLIHDAGPSIRRENRRAVHETPCEELHELLVHRGPADLQFLREVLRMVEPLLEQPEDLAARLRSRNTDQLQRFRHPARRVVTAYFNVLPPRIGRRLPGGR